MKLKILFIRLRNALWRLYYEPAAYGRKLGVKMGEDVKITGKTNWGSEPYMISIGNRVLISFDVSFITHDGATFVIHKNEAYKDIYKFGRIRIGDNCFIGAKSILLPGVKIGNNCIIAAGSIVNKSISDGEVWGGASKVYYEYHGVCRKMQTKSASI